MLVALTALAVAAPVGAEHASSSVGAAAKAKRAPLKVTANVYDSGFTAPTVTVRKGGTIKWLWDSSLIDVHTVTFIRGPRGTKYFSSRSLGPGASYSYKFKKAGKYMIYCKLHAGNTQKITVK
ncbi:MAG: plastocyanin/azurin family copper-binding protein [Solirubrobacteraceae bacterium]|nr:plastocyanin/azurin family copper-binding protein [Solirubrobacteraceae bacterium]